MTGGSMIDLVMMALGSLRFGVRQANYQTFRRTAAYRWEQVDRIGRAPAAQFAGPGVQDVSLEGVIYPAFRGGLRQIDTMRSIAQRGTPLILVDGIGFVWNRWVITSIEEEQTYLMADGAARRIDFTVGLQTYGVDGF